MRIGRTLPPAATPVSFSAIVSGLCGIVSGRRELDRFESELKSYFGAEHCFLVSSGKAAFTLILLALKELCPERDQVLIPAFTCYSVPSAVVRAGLNIRLCDLHSESLDLDFAQLAALLHEQSSRQADRSSADSTGDPPFDSKKIAVDLHASTKGILAVVPTHLYGYPADVSRLRQLIDDPSITIVEDAAQAMGETVDGRKLGTFGDVSFFSLARGKAFSLVEGGVVLTNRADLAATLHRLVGQLPGYGLLPLLKLVVKAVALMMLMHPWLFWIPRNMPFLRLGETLFETDFPVLRMSSFQAGLSRGWGARLQKLKGSREKNVALWTEVLDEIGTRESTFPSQGRLGLLRMPIRVQNEAKRRRLLRESDNKGAGIAPVYPKSINQLSELKERCLPGAFPVAEGCAREIVTLPTHRYLAAQDVTMIRELLSRALSKGDCRSG